MAAYTTINKPSLHFNTKLYSGNGGTQSITGVGFQPDLIWTKSRTNAEWHNWVDAVRGNTKNIYSNATGADVSTRISSFDSDGFSLANNDTVNNGSETFVSWNWKANGAGSANTDGSINTTATSVNTTAGFSISTYTGTGANATVGHGLGAVPKMILIKELNNATNWIVYHADVGNGGGLQLNTTIAIDVDGTFWNSTTPTSSVFSLGVNGNSNGSSDTYVAYCFAEIRGYSKFGSYIGNNNANGTFVYTGFKPAFLMVKNTVNTESWILWDNKRRNGANQSFNPQDGRLLPNANNAEADADIDFLSNGFKIRAAGAAWNANTYKHIYMAFAENPLVNSTGSIPATAR